MNSPFDKATERKKTPRLEAWAIAASNFPEKRVPYPVPSSRKTCVSRSSENWAG